MSKITLPSSFHMDDKIILITGAGDGIGKAVALACGKAGATVILLGKTVQKLELVYDEIIKLGGPEPAIYPMNFEGASADDYQELQTNIDKAFGRLDALFNNAGWLGASSPIELYDVELWYKVMQVNLNAPFMLSKACIPLLKKSESACIVFNTDNKQTAYWGAYSVAKAGAANLMGLLSKELESRHIPVNAFDPVAVRTNFRTRAFPGEDPSQLPVPDEVAKYYVTLLSGDIEQTGQVFVAEDFAG